MNVKYLFFFVVSFEMCFFDSIPLNFGIHSTFRVGLFVSYLGLVL
jgi:hypothetical protein